jgi:hypothetical protein
MLAQSVHGCAIFKGNRGVGTRCRGCLQPIRGAAVVKNPCIDGNLNPAGLYAECPALDWVFSFKSVCNTGSDVDASVPPDFEKNCFREVA